MRDEVSAEVAAVVRGRRALALLHGREVLDLAVARLGDRLAFSAADQDRPLPHTRAQLGFGLRSGQAVARTGRVELGRYRRFREEAIARMVEDLERGAAAAGR